MHYFLVIIWIVSLLSFGWIRDFAKITLSGIVILIVGLVLVAIADKLFSNVFGGSEVLTNIFVAMIATYCGLVIVAHMWDVVKKLKK